MKELLRIVVLCFFSGTVAAQYIPNSGQAFQFAPLYNPAFTGIETFGDLKLGYRYQWTGFKENAPKFVNMAFNFRLKQPLDLSLNSLRTSHNFTGNTIPKRKKSFHALGINVFNEKVGLIDRLGGGFNYALHYPLSDKVHLAGALSAILENTVLDIDEIYLGSDPDPDPFYDNLMKGGTKHTELGVRAGFLIYSDQFYFGASYFPLWTTPLKSSDLDFIETFYKGSLQMGLAFALSDELQFKPSVLALWQANNEFLIDYHAKIYLQNKAWFGASYRSIKNGIISAGLNINEKFSASYSYEFSLGKLKNFSGGSHEIVLAARLNNFKRLNQRTW